MNSPTRSTLQLLRFHFSLFLLPVYLFALSQVRSFDFTGAVLSFLILHLLVYPASNGYNSYMDRDKTPIGGVKSPLQPTRQLYYVTLTMDIIAVLLSMLLGVVFTLGIILYILASRSYSFRGIRLKRFPITGYLVVIFFQGAVTFFLVYTASNNYQALAPPVKGMLAASLLIGGFYPLTQIYQHAADREDGVNTISSKLGYRGTFLFTGIVYALALGVMGWLYIGQNDLEAFLIIQICLLPVLIFYLIWFRKVYGDISEANFSNTMRMNLLASICSNIAFSILIIRNII